MSLAQLVEQELQSLIGCAQPTTVSVVDNTNELSIDFVQIDSLSCAFSELRLNIPALTNSSADDLEEWATALSQRITYLLENIGPLEIDSANQQVLIRSTPPGKSGTTTRFYEIMLAAHAGGNFSLRRYESLPGQAGRQPVPVFVTHEVLFKLIGDLVATIPSP